MKGRVSGAKSKPLMSEDEELLDTTLILEVLYATPFHIFIFLSLISPKNL